jgi:hypothetical protein
LPKGFDYYAGGHVHIVKKQNLPEYKNIIYPGPLFPNSFSEIEKLKHGGFYVYNDNNTEFKKIEIKDTYSAIIDCTNKTPEQVDQLLEEEFKYRDVKDKIVLLRLKGKLKLGKLMDINLRGLISTLYQNGAYFVMKNTSSIISDGFEEIKKSFNKDQIEDEVIEEHLGQVKIDNINTTEEKEIIKKLLNLLAKEKHDGETKQVYEERILKDVDFLE